jgi:restriction system-associated AAA family ATPase
MKLISVKVLGENFRSLQSDKLYSFHVDMDETLLSPKCFVGHNGTGKSNLLELIAEIFFYLDGLFLEFQGGSFHPTANFGFEIEYMLPFTYGIPGVGYGDEFGYGDKYVQVKIEKGFRSSPLFYIKPVERGSYKQAIEGYRALLPRRVIAYSSGNNELLSNAFYKMQYHYFHAYEQMTLKDAEFAVEDSKMFFLDYSSNFSIIIASLLIGDDRKTKKIKDVARIHDLDSFRITLRYRNYRGNEIKYPKKLSIQLERLKRCATTWSENGEGKNKILTIDFLVTQAAKDAFAQAFGTAFDLYKTFYELDMLNIHMVPVTIRELVRAAPKWLNLSEEIPKPDPSKLIFRIEKVGITNAESKILKYKNLSDGEHQFLQIMCAIMMMEEDGNLFLLDEPDTHYTPIWRSKFISTINEVSQKTRDELGGGIRLQEMLLTAHSPFMISDCKKNNVYISTKENGVVSFHHPENETYGTSVSIILDEIFGKADSISQMAKEELEKIIKDIKTIDDLRNAVGRLNSEFGESVEKFDVFTKLRQIKAELENSARK